jgi:hypothetical protein
MKELGKFLREHDTGEDHEHPRPLKDGEGADDQEFLELMSQYKDVRRKDPKAAGKILEKSQQLSEKGDVSPKAKLAAAYL